MQNTDQREARQEGQPSNQFDDAEYKRWSGKLRAPRSPASGGIENFLGQDEKMAKRGENLR
jgi:hypothetical protein